MEDRLPSRKSGSYPVRQAPIPEDRLLSRKTGSCPGTQAPFPEDRLPHSDAGDPDYDPGYERHTRDLSGKLLPHHVRASMSLPYPAESPAGAPKKLDLASRYYAKKIFPEIREVGCSLRLLPGSLLSFG